MKKITYEGKWIKFWTKNNLFDFDFSFEICGYFDNRPRIRIAPWLFNLTIILPFYNKWTDECDPPKWGIAYHNQTLWIYRGGKGNMNGGNKWWTFDSPFHPHWVRTSCLRKDDGWEHSVKGGHKSFWEEKWKNIIWSETYPYVYILNSGEVQNRKAKIRVEEREWRPNWFKWLPFTKRVRRSINIDFNDEVGEQTGSWKGGTIGCGYDMLPNETPLECLRRMEKERKFN